MRHSHDREKNIRLVIILNVSFTILEVIGGLWTNSLAILSDALHDFGDSLALITSWIAEKGAKKKPDKKRTFGYQRLSLFSAVINAIVLVTGSLIILTKAIPRLLSPEHVNADGMLILAIIGIFFNGLGFFRLKKGKSMNEKVLSWHLLEDVLGWAAILIGSLLIKLLDSHLIDPIITIGFTIFIIWGVAKNLRETFNILMEGVPKHIDMESVKRALKKIKGVIKIHDIHIWSLEGETDIFTGHIVVENRVLDKPESTKKRIKKTLKKHHIEHSTIELENEGFCSGIECDEE
jgi:cobalt-zinc-cadmium efflux system protein